MHRNPAMSHVCLLSATNSSSSGVWTATIHLTMWSLTLSLSWMGERGNEELLCGKPIHLSVPPCKASHWTYVCYSRHAEAKNKKKCRKKVFPNFLMVSCFLLAKKPKFNQKLKWQLLKSTTAAKSLILNFLYLTWMWFLSAVLHVVPKLISRCRCKKIM